MTSAAISAAVTVTVNGFTYMTAATASPYWPCSPYRLSRSAVVPMGHAGGRDGISAARAWATSPAIPVGWARAVEETTEGSA